MDDENILSADPRNPKESGHFFLEKRCSLWGVGFGRGGVVSKREEGGGLDRRGKPWRGEGAGGSGDKKTSKPKYEGEEPEGKKDEGDGRVDVFTMYPVARSRGKAGVEGDGQWKVTVLVTWLRHGLALQNNSFTLCFLNYDSFTVFLYFVLSFIY